MARRRFPCMHRLGCHGAKQRHNAGGLLAVEQLRCALKPAPPVPVCHVLQGSITWGRSGNIRPYSAQTTAKLQVRHTKRKQRSQQPAIKHLSSHAQLANGCPECLIGLVILPPLLSSCSGLLRTTRRAAQCPACTGHHFSLGRQHCIQAWTVQWAPWCRQSCSRCGQRWSQSRQCTTKNAQTTAC